MTVTLIGLDHFTGQRNTTPEPDDTARDLARLIRELQAAVNLANGRIASAQAVAATLAETVMIAPAAGVIKTVKALSGAVAHSAESMTVDVKINGTTVLTSVVTLNTAAGTDVQSGTLDTAIAFVEDDLITIERTYVDGGTPTPIVDTLVDVTYSLD